MTIDCKSQLKLLQIVRKGRNEIENRIINIFDKYPFRLANQNNERLKHVSSQARYKEIHSNISKMFETKIINDMTKDGYKFSEKIRKNRLSSKKAKGKEEFRPILDKCIERNDAIEKIFNSPDSKIDTSIKIKNSQRTQINNFSLSEKYNFDQQLNKISSVSEIGNPTIPESFITLVNFRNTRNFSLNETSINKMKNPKEIATTESLNLLTKEFANHFKSTVYLDTQKILKGNNNKEIESVLQAMFHSNKYIQDMVSNIRFNKKRLGRSIKKTKHNLFRFKKSM